MMKQPLIKEQLEHMYNGLGMTHLEIGLALGYADHQPVMRAFKRFGIVSRTKQLINETKRFNLDRDELVNQLRTKSASQIARDQNV